MLGLGIGWLEEEFAALGAPFEKRGKRADEYLEALQAVWTGEEVNYQGEFVNWQGFMMRPKPAQAGGVPLVIGGVSKPAIRRTVQYGTGWYVIGKDLEEYRAHMKTLAEECARQGRDPKELEITAYWDYYNQGIDSLSVYEELGIHRLLINVHALRQSSADAALEQFANDVIAARG